MSNEEMLREALEDIRTEADCASITPETYNLLETLILISYKATEALDRLRWRSTEKVERSARKDREGT